MTKETRDAIDEAIDKCLSVVGEHGATCRIFVSLIDDDGENFTRSVSKGCGNWNAQMGQIAAWVDYQNEIERCRARREAKEENDQ